MLNRKVPDDVMTYGMLVDAYVELGQYDKAEESAQSITSARRLASLTPQHDEGGPVDPSASLEKRLKLGAGGQPLASGEATR